MQAALVSFRKHAILLFPDPLSALRWLGEPGNEIGLIDYMGTEEEFFRQYPTEEGEQWTRVEMAKVTELPL